MAHRVFESVPVSNGLLISLCEEDWARLEPDLHKVELQLNQAVQVVGEPLEEVFFVEKGIISLVVTLLDGEQVEAGLAGPEGMVGIPLVLGDDRGLHDTRVQMAGTALRLQAAPLHDAMERSPRLRRLLLRYSLAFHAQVMVTAACNARHFVENRFARWLLLVHDRAGSDTFPMTHEFASMMLGVRRPSVSIAAGSCRRPGSSTTRGAS